MKRTSILPFVASFAVAIIFASCGPSRVYSSQGRPAPPPSRNYFSLIISPTPGFAMSRYPDGRYYHRSPQGFVYWKGYDNRFYLDRSHLHRVRYSNWEYNQWKKYNKYSRKYRGGSQITDSQKGFRKVKRFFICIRESLAYSGQFVPLHISSL